MCDEHGWYSKGPVKGEKGLKAPFEVIQVNGRFIGNDA